MAGLLDLNRVLDVNALVNSGNGNQGNGVTKNEVGGNQEYRQGINDQVPDDNDTTN